LIGCTQVASQPNTQQQQAQQALSHSQLSSR
jgi:hypothetical protein